MNNGNGASFEIFSPDDNEVAQNVFFRELFTSDMKGGLYFASREYDTPKKLDWLLRHHKNAEIRFVANERGSLSFVIESNFKGEKITVLLERARRGRAWTNVKVCAARESVLNAYLRWLDKLIPLRPKQKQERDEAVRVSFLFQGEMGRAQSIIRDLEAPVWSDIKGNYSKAAAASLESLIGTDLNELQGKFGVLHGPAGTGKTSYLRALMQSWRKQARFTYIMDAEDFFRDAKYMVQLIFENLSHESGFWNVIICEDAEEFIAPDAKKDVGQALSRLLNLGDGMLGQGLQLLFLFTTNAKLDTLHPAMIRKGRCFSNIEVPPLTSAEASEWLGREVTEDTTLADLYAMKAEDHGDSGAQDS